MKPSIEYWPLNHVTVKNEYMFLCIDAVFNMFKGMLVYSKIDLWSCYYQL